MYFYSFIKALLDEIHIYIYIYIYYYYYSLFSFTSNQSPFQNLSFLLTYIKIYEIFELKYAL